jgi:hypothetical protein
VDFTATTVTITHNNFPVMQGHRCNSTKLWHIDTVYPATTVSDPPFQWAGGAIGANTAAQLVAFAHASMFSPSLSTLAQALQKGYVHDMPGLTHETLRKYPPISIPMLKGHMDQQRKNLRSTKTMHPSKYNSLTDPVDDDAVSTDPDTFPSPSVNGERTHHCYATIFEPTGKIFTDLTGRFIAASSNGNNYMVVIYDYDSNLIWAEPITSRSATNILQAYKKLHKILCDAGMRPALQRMDNECSDILKQFMKE